MKDEDILRKVDKIIRTTKDGTYRPPDPTPAVDPYDLKNHTEDSLKGRSGDPEDIGWRKVMEHHGFTWYPPHILDQTIGPMRTIASTHRAIVDASEFDDVEVTTDPLTGRRKVSAIKYRPHEVGQWRRARPTTESFTSNDLVALFGEPEEFDRWIRNHERKRTLHG